MSYSVVTITMIPQEREMDIRKQALEEERRRREELEKRLQEETNRRQKLIEREVKLREKQRAQVRKGKKKDELSLCFIQTITLTLMSLWFILLPAWFQLSLC